jgi:WD40 repeat protein
VRLDPQPPQQLPRPIAVEHQIGVRLVGQLLGPTNPDGKILATASRDRTAGLWDFATRRRLATLRHGTVVHALAFKPDGTRPATACDDGTVRLWDVATFGAVAELRGHRAYVHSVAFSPGGDRIVSGSGDYYVRI